MTDPVVAADDETSALDAEVDAAQDATVGTVTLTLHSSVSYMISIYYTPKTPPVSSFLFSRFSCGSFLMKKKKNN